MKKIITGAFAAIALLLGFTSCGTDLHDMSKGDPKVEGWALCAWERSELDPRSWVATLNDTPNLEIEKQEDGVTYYKPIEWTISGGATICIDFGIKHPESWNTGRYEFSEKKELEADTDYKLTAGLNIENDADRSYITCAKGDVVKFSVKDDNDGVYISFNINGGQGSAGSDLPEPPDAYAVVGGKGYLMAYDKGSEAYSFSIDNEANKAVFEDAKINGLAISSILHDGNTYGLAASATVEIDKEIALEKDGSTVSIEKELFSGKYKSFTFTMAIKADENDPDAAPTVTLKMSGELSAIDTAYIVGDFTAGAFIPMIALGGNFLAYTFEYKKVSGSWTNSVADIGFKVVAKDDWDGNTEYVNQCEPTVNSEAKKTGSGNSSDKNTNVFVKDLKEGSTYTIIVDGKNASEATVKIITGDEPLFIAGSLNGWTFGLMERDETGSYITIAEAGVYEFKAKKGCGWDDSPNGAEDTVFAGATVTSAETATVEDTTSAEAKNAMVTTTKANAKLYVYKNESDKYVAKLVE